MFNLWLDWLSKKISIRAPQLPRWLNVEHFLQNGFRADFCEVMGTGIWDRRVHDDLFRGTNPNQFWVQRIAQAEPLVQ